MTHPDKRQTIILALALAVIAGGVLAWRFNLVPEIGKFFAAEPGGTRADIDGSGTVDIFDYNLVVSNFGKSGTGIQGDLDANGTVDIFDYNLLVQDYGKTVTSTPSTSPLPSQSAVRKTEKDIPGYDPDHRVGVFYFLAHIGATYSALTTHTDFTLTDVVEGRKSFSSFYGGDPDYGKAIGYFYEEKPLIGFYCLFRPVTVPVEQVDLSFVNTWACDQDRVSAVAADHARKLVDAGVDYVIIDLSNAATIGSDAGAVLTALRPTQILFQEWNALRQAGIPTPQIAVFAPLPAGATTWRYYLDLYDAYPDLAMTQQVTNGPGTGKHIFFYVDAFDSRRPSPTIIDQVKANGVKNDVVTVPLWTHNAADGTFGVGYLDRWAFIAPCRTASGGQTTSVANSQPCDQLSTPNSSIGSEITVAASYQVGYTSYPFQAPGKLGGLTLKKQFAKALSLKPNYLLISSWNELAAGFWRAPNGADPQTMLPELFAMGMEDEGVQRFAIDSYTSEFSKDIEPTVESGTKYYDLVRSCIGQYKTGVPVTIKGQSCSSLTNPYVNVHSLTEVQANNAQFGQRHILTVQDGERQTLLAGPWREIANRFVGPTDFPADSNEPEYHSGPFIAFNSQGSGRKALYRCYNTVNGKHFFTVNAGECDFPTNPYRLEDPPLAWISSTKTAEMPRALYRCYQVSGDYHFHSLGLKCPADAREEGLLGYVR